MSKATKPARKAINVGLLGIGTVGGGTFEVLATNTLDDGFDASAALVDDHLYLRGYRYLYGVSAR